MDTQQKQINDFSREYLDKRRVLHWNRIKPTGTTYEHFRMVCDICWWLYKNDIQYCTEAKFESGYEPDILCPGHIMPIIEVRHTEDDVRTNEKFRRIPSELQSKIIYVEADQEFTKELIL